MPFLRPDPRPPGYPEDYFPLPGTGERPEVILRQVSPNAFQLLWGFTYEAPGSPADTGCKVPQHNPKADPEENSTDLASVPPLLWWLIASYGLHTRAALFHDHFVDHPPKGKTRKDVDTLFRNALRESEVRWLRRWLMWTAVSLRTRFGRVGLVVILLHLTLLTFVTLFWLFGHRPWWPLGWMPASSRFDRLPGWPWKVTDPGWPFDKLDAWPFATWWPALLAGVVGFGWGLRRWPLAVVGFALVAAPALLAYLSRGIVLLTEFFEELLVKLSSQLRGKPREFKRPQFRPYQREPGPF
jgi:hypothetical protein